MTPTGRPDGHANLLGDTRRRVVELLRRSARTVAELAGALALTPNAVRAHLTALERDGLVTVAGKRREGVGKPAAIYRLAPAGEALFPKAYATVLHEVLVTLGDRLGREGLEEVLRETGRRVAASAPGGDTPDARLEAARAFLTSLGALVELVDGEQGARLQGYACPLAAVTPEHREVCELVREVVEGIVRAPVRTACIREGDRPRCAFEVAGDASG